jgi:hypothetical protein
MKNKFDAVIVFYIYFALFSPLFLFDLKNLDDMNFIELILFCSVSVLAMCSLWRISENWKDNLK